MNIRAVLFAFRKKSLSLIIKKIKSMSYYFYRCNMVQNMYFTYVIHYTEWNNVDDMDAESFGG